ncbi:MAG TPA: YhjD/YihY/BrkB family envelope integrity protein, partial [Verrucomicrobiae bacterium]
MAINKSRLRKLKQDALTLWDESFHADQELSRLHKFLHFWVLVVKSFNRNRCPIRASALSFTTLLALIPMLAVAIGITSSLLKKKGEDQVYRVVDKLISSMMAPAALTNAPPGTTGSSTNAAAKPEDTNATPVRSADITNAPAEAASTNSSESASNNIASSSITATNESTPPADTKVAETQKEAERRIHEFVSNTRSGTLGVTGAILLVLVGIRMLGSIESTFNDIWGVTRGRNWLSRIQIYCTGIVFGPLLLVGGVALISG